VGASAAAVAACSEHGAIGLLDAALLPEELGRLAGTMGPNGNAHSGPGNGHGGGNGAATHFPPRYHGLMRLTPSERRVLSYMMEGQSATEIASGLVVSLTTIRSHIRMILSKLQVTSQLAAVAVASGSLPERRLGRGSCPPLTGVERRHHGVRG